MEATQTVNLSIESMEALAALIGESVSIQTTNTLSVPETLTVSVPATLTTEISAIGQINDTGLMLIAVLIVIMSAIWLGGEITERWIRSQR